MKNKIKFYLGLFFLITSSFLLIQKKDISVNDIKKALRLSGVTFNEKDIQTMAPYVIRNKNSYVNMREYNLTKDNVPAFNFSVNNMRSKKTKYTFEDIKTKLPSNKKDIPFLSIGELSYLIKNQIISSLELTKIYLERIKLFDKKLNAFITITEKLALKQAENADDEIKKGMYRGELHGIPYSIKDLASFPNYPTTWGAMPFKNQKFD